MKQTDRQNSSQDCNRTERASGATHPGTLSCTDLIKANPLHAGRIKPLCKQYFFCINFTNGESNWKVQQVTELLSPSVVHPLIPRSIGSFRRGCYSAICRNNSFYYSRDGYNSGQDAHTLPPNEGILFLMESLFWGPWPNFSRCQWVSSGAQLQVPQGRAGCPSACRHGKRQHGACQRGLTSSSASFHASSRLDLDWEMGANAGERWSCFPRLFSTSKGRVAEIHGALLKCLCVNEGRAARKRLVTQAWPCQCTKGRSNALPSCSSLNCLCFLNSLTHTPFYRGREAAG